MYIVEIHGMDFITMNKTIIEEAKQTKSKVFAFIEALKRLVQLEHLVPQLKNYFKFFLNLTYNFKINFYQVVN